MAQTLTCPACGLRGLDLNDYESMIVLRADLALFSLRCNRCASKISSVQPIPATLREEVRFAAIEIGAGMGLE